METSGDALEQVSNSADVTVSRWWTKKSEPDGGAGWTINCEEVSMCCFTFIVLTCCSIAGDGDCDLWFVTGVRVL